MCGHGANHIVTITPIWIKNFFNRCIQQLAKQGIFPKKIHAACDCTLYETTSKFKGRGSITRKVKVKARGYRKSSELKEVLVTLYTWKVWASMMGTSKNQNFGSRSRHAKILTAGIHRSISRIKI